MTTIKSTKATIKLPDQTTLTDEAQLAATAFLARYSGLGAGRRTATTSATWLAASTIDPRLSPMCGVYHLAYIDGRVR